MRPPCWFGTVIKGRIKLDNNPQFTKYLESFEGKRVELVLKGYDPVSKSDRGYYYAEVVPAFADYMGYPKEEKTEVHNKIKEFMGVESTKKFKASEWKEYVEGVKRKAGPLGVVIREKRFIDIEEEPTP